MACKTLPLIDQLESRVLFSLTPAQAVAADKVKLHADQVQLSLDRKSLTGVVSNDRAQLKSDFSTELTSAENQYKSDVAAGKLLITTDQTNGQATIKNDRATISADQKAVVADKRDPVAEAAALSKLVSDRQILTTDTTNLKTTVSNDKLNLANQQKADLAGLNAVRKQSTDVLIVDKNKIVADSKTSASTIGTDLKTIAADEIQLAKDEYQLLKSTITNLF